MNAIFALIMTVALTCMTCLGDVECLKVSGSFDIPVATWKVRRQSGGIPAVEISTSAVLSVIGHYVTAGMINGKPSWKQLGGNNVMWFGDRLNPQNSFDAWYIGDPGCAQVPAKRFSVPRLPTFVPNELALGVRNFDPCDRTRAVGMPVIERVVITDAEALVLSNMTQVIIGSLELDESVIISGISLSGEVVRLWWASHDGMSYQVQKSQDMASWDTVVYTNATPPENILFKKNSQTALFYRILGKRQ
jgi:hypothetical protein